MTPEQLKWNVYPDMGNLTSASMPVAMARAIQAGELQRGDSIALWMAAAEVTCPLWAPSSDPYVLVPV